MKKEYYIVIIAIALVIKFSLFAFQLNARPQSIFHFDSYSHLETATALVADPSVSPQKTHFLRNGLKVTPGYPLFLAILHKIMGIPLSGVIFVQILLTILTSFIIYKTATQIDPRLGFISAAIFLYATEVTILSLTIMTESLFLILITFFMYYFIQYLKIRELKPLIVSSVMLIFAIYVRPGSYALGATMSVFIIYANAPKDFKKAMLHALVFFIIVYAFLVLWQIRKYVILGDSAFWGLDQTTSGNELLHSYSENVNLHAPGGTPVQYYLFGIWSSFWSLMSRPQSLKDFHCDHLNSLIKVIGYLWIFFCGIGFVYGIAKIGRNIYFHFILFLVINYVCGTILGEMWVAGSRYRVQIVPFLSILSAYGWILLIYLFKENHDKVIVMRLRPAEN